MSISDAQLSGKDVRLFPAHHINSDREAELRATAAFLAVARAVPELGRFVVSTAGGPKGRIRCYAEVPFVTQSGSMSCEHRPDGIIRSTFGKKDWIALLEVKVGNSALEQAQFDCYHNLAIDHQLDALITISNKPALTNGLPPDMKIDGRCKKVRIVHFSWERLLSEAQLLSRQNAVADTEQQWLLEEWIRYLEDEKSRIIEMPQLGEHWNTVLQHAREGNLGACRLQLQDIAERWDAFLKKVALRLRAKLGVDVAQKLSRAEAKDATVRTKNLLENAVGNGQLSGEFRIPDAAGDLSLAVLLASRLMQCSISLDAPNEGRVPSRIKWLLRQLRSEGSGDSQLAPSDLLIQIDWGWGKCSQARLEELSDRIDKLMFDGNNREIPKDALPHSFSLQWSRHFAKGKGRSTAPVLDDIQKGLEEFYSRVVERIRRYVPRAPELEVGRRQEDEETAVVAVARDTTVSPDSHLAQRAPAETAVDSRADTATQGENTVHAPPGGRDQSVADDSLRS